MNNVTRVYAVVEGQTEQSFVASNHFKESIGCNVTIAPILIGKRQGAGGGDVRFERAKRDIGKLLEQDPGAYVTTMFDYFRIDPKWPGMSEINQNMTVAEKTATLEAATKQAIQEAFPRTNAHERFVPYFAMHEFEAMLFSDPEILANTIGVNTEQIQSIVESCGEPEEINDGAATSPSKRILQMCPRYRKVVMGKKISKKTGLAKIRQECPIFNAWMEKLTALTV